MSAYVLGFDEIDAAMTAQVGGKGANLGELSRIDGVRVPDGFCVTTEAYRSMAEQTPGLAELLDRLAQVGQPADGPDQAARIAEISAEIRRTIAGTPVPAKIAAAVLERLEFLGVDDAYAVRSSATAEDLASASFAGQQDTFLNVVGQDDLLTRIADCWASLFTDRAVAYRIQNGFDHRDVELAVVVQKMIFGDVAGVMFTADPITSDRRVTSIDASFGLGEAIVSGMVNADNYTVRDRRILAKKIGTKKIAVRAHGDAGTAEATIAPDRQDQQALSDDQILRLAAVGDRIQDHYGNPRDIEWSLDDRGFFVVQSRPITTLFPVPEVGDKLLHVYTSFSHQQMMTDAMTPFGLSFFRRVTTGTTLVPIGGRLYFDVSNDLSRPVGRKIRMAVVSRTDPLTHTALQKLLARDGFVASLPRGKSELGLGGGYFSAAFFGQLIRLSRSRDSSVITELMAADRASVQQLRRRFAGRSPAELLRQVEIEQPAIQRALYDARSMAAVYVGVMASSWLDKHIEKWLGEKGAANALSLSVQHNVTADMGLDLIDVADVVRRYPEIVEYLAHPDDRTFFDDLGRLPGGEQVIASLRAYLDRYGARCPGEIDITRPRFTENPAALAPMILADIAAYGPGARKMLQERGLRTAQEKQRDVLDRLEQLPGGRRKARQTRSRIEQLRAFSGYREYPKYAMMQRFWVIKQALLSVAEHLRDAGVITETSDIWFLSFEELQQAVADGRIDHDAISRRKQDHAAYMRLTPPRVMTSDGEIIPGDYDAGDVPKGALPGLPASSGTVEGRARVVSGLEDLDFGDDDILVTEFTDPSWTPVFLSVKGLVTEVGGMMTHGSVIAREYGLPAVVGVQNATTLITDGQRLRVNGTDGYVQVLSGAPSSESSPIPTA